MAVIFHSHFIFAAKLEFMLQTCRRAWGPGVKPLCRFKGVVGGKSKFPRRFASFAIKRRPPAGIFAKIKQFSGGNNHPYGCKNFGHGKTETAPLGTQVVPYDFITVS